MKFAFVLVIVLFCVIFELLDEVWDIYHFKIEFLVVKQVKIEQELVITNETIFSFGYFLIVVIRFRFFANVVLIEWEWLDC